MALDRTLIVELSFAAILTILTGVVGSVYIDLQTGKKERLENRKDIEEANKVGEGEIRRSSDVDDNQKEMILYNKETIKELRGDIKEMYREIGEVGRDVHHAHKRDK
jgi:hypothetical protein